MTVKDIQKLLLEQGVETEQAAELFSRIRDKPFWIFDKVQHAQTYEDTGGDCCMQHIIPAGLPRKQNIEKPLFDYEQLLYDILFKTDGSHKDKHVFCVKATGLGVTEFFIRLMVWLCLKDDTYQNSQMVIVTGPSLDIAIGLIRRMKTLFGDVITFDEPMTILTLNRCRIAAFPSHHVDSFRALEIASFILLDEADFFPSSEQTSIRHVAERYIGKSNPYLILISTPNAPNGLFQNIERI